MSKSIILKLGSACNLRCKHCHSQAVGYKYNPDIIKYIIDNGFNKVSFGGGEPLLYIDTIKEIVSKLPADMNYRLVTNGTLLTYELAEYFNEHNFKVVFSYDGNNKSRDRRIMQAWDEYSTIKKQGISSLFSIENSDIEAFASQMELVRERYLMHAIGSSLWLNFPHVTTKNNNDGTDMELAKKYCKAMAVQIETDFLKYSQGEKFNLSALGMAFNKWIKKNNAIGVKCCNADKINLTIDGRFILCPYGTEYVGDIYKGIDWEKVNSFIPEKCKKCNLWECCKNSCIVNTTDLECWITKVMHKHIYKLMDKYNVTYDEMYKLWGDPL